MLYTQLIMMNVASAISFPLPLLTQRTASVTSTSKPSTAELLSNIPRNAEAAIALSEQIADAFAANPTFKISSNSSKADSSLAA